jgi:hypothetical protein
VLAVKVINVPRTRLQLVREQIRVIRGASKQASRTRAWLAKTRASHICVISYHQQCVNTVVVHRNNVF